MLGTGTLVAAVSLATTLASTAPSDSPRTWPEHEAIETFLKDAKITERRKLGEGVTNPEKITLEMDGEVRHAIYKRVDSDYDSWRYEVAAYELDKALGLGMVPPTVPRSIRGRRGCLQLWVNGTTVAKFEGEIEDLESWRSQVSIMWLFDDLIANVDRHLNNAMVGDGHQQLILIDNSKTFRTDTRLFNGLNSGRIGTHAKFWRVVYDEDRESFPTKYPPWLLKRLRDLGGGELKDAIGRYIDGYRRSRIEERLELILSRLDDLESVASDAQDR